MTRGHWPIVGSYPARLRVAWLVLALAVACGPPDVGVQELQRRTVPNGASATGVSGPQRTAIGLRFTWDVRSSMSWDEYRQSMAAAFKRDFDVIQSDSSSLVLSRHVNGDVYRLEFHAAVAVAGTEAHVTFSASAD